MKKQLLAPVIIATAATFSIADEPDKERKEDIAKHRAIAAAHEATAKCLEAGKKEEVCLKELQDSCKGLAIGKFCGMKHQH
jgi:hypothetical protein